MGWLGGSASASNTLSNIISYSPSLNMGEDNTNDTATRLDQRASSEALNKDTLSASVGVGVGGGSGSGGAVVPTESNYRTNQAQSGISSNDDFFNRNKNGILYGALALGFGGVVYIISKKKR